MDAGRALHQPFRGARPRIVATTLAAGLIAMLVASCSGNSESSAESSAGSAAAPAQGVAAKPAGSDDSGGAASGSGTSPEFAGSQTDGKAAADTSAGTPVPAGLLAGPPANTKRVRTADLQVKVANIGDAASKIRAAAIRLGGSIASEDSRSPQDGTTGQDVLIVRVPEPKLEDAISAVTGTGTEVSRTSSSDDVTAVLADLASREASQRASVERVRELMAKATSLQDVVLLESELSRRETDLEAAQASHRALADQAAQATLTVTLTTSGKPVVHSRPKDDSGFMAGLHKGWHALLASTGVLLTVLGALLPLGVVLLVIGWPAYVIVQRRRTRSSTAAAQP